MKIQASQRMVYSDGHFLAKQQEKIKEILQSGNEVINLGRGNPDLETFPSIVEKFEDYVENPDNHGYPPYGGKDSLKQAIIDFYKSEYQVTLEQDEVTIFSGSLSALTALPMALVNPGEVVLTPTPSFFGYNTGIQMSGGLNIKMPLLEKNKYLPDLSLFSKEILQKTKLMFLNYPHNPTGAGATREFFEEAIEFALKNNIVIAHDFAYADICFEGKAISFLQVPESKRVGIEIYTLSKTFNMAGWRIAFAVGNREVISLINRYIRSSVGGTFGAIQDAVSYGLGHSKLERDKLRDIYANRRELVLNQLGNSQFQVSPSAGTFFLWVKLPEYFPDDIRFSNDLLAEERVAVVAGSAFGEEGRGYIRISLVSDIAELREGINRLIRFCDKFGKG